MSLEHEVVVFVIFPVHWLVLVLQYWLEGQLLGEPVPQVPDPLQVDDITAVQSLLHWLGQAVSLPG
jgi:hypothetical protein